MEFLDVDVPLKPLSLYDVAVFRKKVEDFI